ncbi:hypothetical protein COCCU_14470 (plasmid) [Corynebacterium occultum]|uniref:Uncharacterized protein n=1 Tax=Corynebacterium occultum TaxID=2675219 RepID=A0A6B8W5G9_9CORY|nr:hypothetical protein COCCU_14470 [Corynebacterium occultum]
MGLMVQTAHTFMHYLHQKDRTLPIGSGMKHHEKTM